MIVDTSLLSNSQNEISPSPENELDNHQPETNNNHNNINNPTTTPETHETEQNEPEQPQVQPEPTIPGIEDNLDHKNDSQPNQPHVSQDVSNNNESATKPSEIIDDHQSNLQPLNPDETDVQNNDEKDSTISDNSATPDDSKVDNEINEPVDDITGTISPDTDTNSIVDDTQQDSHKSETPVEPEIHNDTHSDSVVDTITDNHQEANPEPVDPVKPEPIPEISEQNNNSEATDNELGHDNHNDSQAETDQTIVPDAQPDQSIEDQSVTDKTESVNEETNTNDSIDSAIPDISTDNNLDQQSSNGNDETNQESLNPVRPDSIDDKNVLHNEVVVQIQTVIDNILNHNGIRKVTKQDLKNPDSLRKIQAAIIDSLNQLGVSATSVQDIVFINLDNNQVGVQIIFFDYVQFGADLSSNDQYLLNKNQHSLTFSYELGEGIVDQAGQNIPATEIIPATPNLVLDQSGFDLIQTIIQNELQNTFSQDLNTETGMSTVQDRIVNQLAQNGFDSQYVDQVNIQWDSNHISPKQKVMVTINFKPDIEFNCKPENNSLID